MVAADTVVVKKGGFSSEWRMNKETSLLLYAQTDATDIVGAGAGDLT